MDDYITDDTFEAAVFLSVGENLDKMELNGRRVQFTFKNTDSFQQKMNDYLSKKILVEPFLFQSNLDYLYKTVYRLTGKNVG
jgi:hypothetical protein